MRFATLRSAVTLILPAYPELDPPIRAAVERDVVQYVATQIRSMPPFLRLPCELAIAAFGMAPMLRFGRPFARLAPTRQSAYLRRWDTSPILPMRDLVKLIRSTALFAYFDHSIVRQRLGSSPEAGSSRRSDRHSRTLRSPSALGTDHLPSTLRTEVLVLGSGAGGAATAATLAARGYEVVVLEEGPNYDTNEIATNSPEAIAALYRNAGLTPILGNQTIAYVEGRCVGGSTEVNSAFWHRLPADCYQRWRSDAQLVEFSAEILEPYFERLERELSVSYLDPAAVPRSSELFRHGIEAMGWQYAEVPRCQKRNDGSSPFAAGNKQSMQRTFLPAALAAGATILPNCKALRLIHQDGRTRGALVQRANQRLTIDADFVFVCCGAVQTAALLQRSGITRNVGNNLRIHPMIKAAALFDEELRAHDEVLPIYQVKEFWPNISIGGSVCTPGFLAMLLADNWVMQQDAMRTWDRTAIYYAATRGMNRGTIRALPGSSDGVLVRYRLTDADQKNISDGLAHLGEILFAAGARAVYPSLRSYPALETAEQFRRLLAQPIARSAMSLSTVHAFSSCPMGENPDLCATDSFGKVSGFRNLYINDASLLPDSPGVNPQGTIMAIALRNLDYFDASQRHGPSARRQHH